MSAFLSLSWKYNISACRYLCCVYVCLLLSLQYAYLPAVLSHVRMSTCRSFSCFDVCLLFSCICGCLPAFLCPVRYGHLPASIFCMYDCLPFSLLYFCLAACRSLSRVLHVCLPASISCIIVYLPFYIMHVCLPLSFLRVYSTCCSLSCIYSMPMPSYACLQATTDNIEATQSLHRFKKGCLEAQQSLHGFKYICRMGVYMKLHHKSPTWGGGSKYLWR